MIILDSVETKYARRHIRIYTYKLGEGKAINTINPEWFNRVHGGVAKNQRSLSRRDVRDDGFRNLFSLHLLQYDCCGH